MSWETHESASDITKHSKVLVPMVVEAEHKVTCSGLCWKAHVSDLHIVIDEP